MAGIYIHIPFCKSRCIYCDFYSTTGMVNKFADRYASAIKKEFELRRNELGDDKIQTIYLGGGTPSFFPQVLIDKIIRPIDRTNVEEFTIEVNPDDITPDYCRQLQKSGINRVSMGVQSFNDNELRLINRRHSATDAICAIKLLKESGVDNISIDLIYGLPQQTFDSWRKSIDIAVSLNLKHISAYSLTYEQGTPLWKMREQGIVNEIDEELSIEMYNHLVKVLSDCGFEHYEISNFALPCFRSRHNSAYWDFTPYLGLGAAAHSFDGNVRRFNPNNIETYLKKIENGGTAFITEQTEWWEKYDEMIMVRLRTAEGVNANQIKATFGKSVYDTFINKAKELVSKNQLITDGTTYRISPSAIMLADSIILHLMHDN